VEEEIRKAAVRRYILQGESPKTIYISLNRSKQWFYKWLKRYHTQGKEWHKDRDFSRTPVNNQREGGWREKGKTFGIRHRPEKTERCV
jgi:transposase